MDAGLTEPGAVVPGAWPSLVSRVQALGPQVAAALEAAAVAGREFDPGLVAGIADIDLDEAIAALDRAVDAQLVTAVSERPGRMAFVHDLVHEALTIKLRPGRSASLHARAVDVLEPRAAAGADDALTAAAGHAIAALPAIDVQRAGELAERAGLRLVAGRAPADAAQLLAGALTACEDAGAPIALCVRLRLTLGDALRAAGSEEAGETFESALTQARRTGDGALVARAALGVAGPVVTISAVDRGRVAILEEALDALAGEESALAAQAQSRLAVELAYDADTDRRERLSATALSTARARGDPRTLAAALGARHVVLWGPDHTGERLPLADEMLALARRADDPALELQARTWRIVDLEELGDGAALEAELDAYAATAARVPHSALAWYVAAWQSSRAFLAGRPARARELQRQAVRLGRRVGDTNVQFVQRAEFILALADDRAHDIDILWQTDRVRKSPVGWAYRALSTWAMAADGQVEEARRALKTQRRAGVPRSWPRDTNWLSAAKELSEAACVLDDLEVAADLEELLEPFAERMVVSARALMCMGSVWGALGPLAALRGDLHRAVECFELAIDRDERAGALIWAMHHRLRLGETLLARGQAVEALPLLKLVAARAPDVGPEPSRRARPLCHHQRVTSFAIVGGGLGGVAAAVMLRREGYEQLTVFERGERVGGVLEPNTYPGAACDVPSHLYEFSFPPNPRWSRRYAPQAEIHDYIEDVARRHGVLDSVRTRTEVTRAEWDAERERWLLETSAGRFEADVLVTACGQLSVPKMPSIPGLDTFSGPAFHTAEWRHDVDLSGKRVAVIGTGCSAIQTVSPRYSRSSSSSTSTSARPDGRCRRWTSHTPSGRSGCSRASRPCSAWIACDTRVHGPRRGGDDEPPLAAGAVPVARAAADRRGDRRSRAAPQGHAERRDRLQAPDAHRRLVPDADQAERRADHRPDRRRHATACARATAASAPPTCWCSRPAFSPTASSRRWRWSATAVARSPRSGGPRRTPTSA